MPLVDTINSFFINWFPSLIIPFVIICAIQFYGSIKVFLFNQIIKIPTIKHRIDEKRDELRKKFRQQILSENEKLSFINKLPEKGISDDHIAELLQRYRNLCKFHWNSGTVSGCVYRKEPVVNKTILKVYELFHDFNPLHPDIFPGTRKMEAEIVHMVASMYNGNDDVTGTVTSGGTESLMLAVKTYRDIARANRNIKFPEIIMPRTAHPALQKACDLFGIKAVIVDVDDGTKKVKWFSVTNKINKNTCAIFLSAPNYPYGVIDPINEIAEKCQGVPIHVDACLGSFIVPFLDTLPVFDFRIAGVTSISCDTHKYGLAPKGTSVILYRNEDIFYYQIFSYADWPGGLYATSSLAGSRSGFLSAACWATMLTIGREGYRERALKINDAAKRLANGWSSVNGIKLLAKPEVSVVAASCQKRSYRFVDMMKSKGWCLNDLQNPPGFHFAVTELHTEGNIIQRLIEDSAECMKELEESSTSDPCDMEVLYSTNMRLPDHSIVKDIAIDYILANYAAGSYANSEQNDETTVR